MENEDKKDFPAELSDDMRFRITNDGDAHDVREIYEMLKEYNLKHRESSQNVPIGVFLEDKRNRKIAGLTGETFGNWLCTQTPTNGTTI